MTAGSLVKADKEVLAILLSIIIILIKMSVEDL